jgi:uncharacterized membrane protein YtjA (UPF0391 family)
MIKWAIVFAIISIIAGVFGFTGIAAGSAAVAKILFFIALAIFIVLLLIGLFVGRRVTR